MSGPRPQEFVSSVLELDKLKNWTISHKRRVVQLFTAVLYNLNIRGFFSGSIYKGNTKVACVPGLNCYSCPGATAACPLGSLQAALGEIRYNKFPFYVIGSLLVFGILLGRAICAFLCPFGLMQEILHKIPGPKLKKSKWTRRLSLLKYGIFGVFVLLLPLCFMICTGVATPAFCKFICPAGTLGGGLPLVTLNKYLQKNLGFLFRWKVIVLLLVLVASVFIYRFFCRFLCPLGAIYSFFNRHAMFGVAVDKTKCTHCALCTKSCKMDVKEINDHECIRCGDCKKVCPCGAVIHKTPWKTQNSGEQMPCENKEDPS
jgi:polyferredoxin